MSKHKLEYIWLDGYQPTQSLRSKTKVESDFSGKLEDAGEWNFDGSSTEQASGDDSDTLLKPVAVYPDPDRFGGNGWLVMCEVLNADGTPHESNGRATISNDDEDFWFGFEQEYTLIDPDTNLPLGFPENGFPGPRARETILREAQWKIGIRVDQGIFLFKSKPEIFVVIADRGPTIGLVRCAVGIKHFAHDKPPVSAKTIRIRINSDGFEERVRIVSGGLLGRGSIKIPLTRVLQLAAKITLDLGFTAQALRRLIAVEPNIFQLMFTHLFSSIVFLFSSFRQTLSLNRQTGCADARRSQSDSLSSQWVRANNLPHHDRLRQDLPSRCLRWIGCLHSRHLRFLARCMPPHRSR